MIDLFRAVHSILSPRERRQAALVFLTLVFLGILETAGVASIMPFLAVAGNPEVVETTPVLGWLYDRLGFRSSESFLVALGVASLVVLVAGSLFRLVAGYATLRFVSMRRHSLAYRLFATFLGRPYTFFLNRNSSDLSKGVLAESSEVVTQLLRPLLDVVAYSVIIVLIIGFLVAVNPLMALVVTGALGGAYGFIYLLIRSVTKRFGAARASTNRVRFHRVSEAFGGIKEIKLRGLESHFLREFEGPSIEFARVQAMNAVLAQAPRYVIEAVAFGMVMCLALYNVTGGRDLGVALPLLGGYALAAYRLLPALQQLYSGVVNVRFGVGALDSFISDLNDRGVEPEPRSDAPDAPTDPLSLKEGIRLEGVSFRYPGAERSSIRTLDVEIAVNTTVGVVGTTGAGKTTLVDLVLGLLRPTTGCIRADGVDIWAGGIRRWQSIVGYVPQVIHLADASVAANIAYGLPPDRIDMGAVVRAAQAAQIHDFVVGQLPQGYETQVGERGVRLSGGQRQRIGIARALYLDPQVLVLDEGTSALDSLTESSVMEAIHLMAETRTVILVAHRLTTVRDCDQILVMDRGELVGVGTYEDLSKTNQHFAELAGGTLAEVRVDGV